MSRDNFQVTQTSGERASSQLVITDNVAGSAKLTSLEAFKSGDGISTPEVSAAGDKLSAQATDLLSKPEVQSQSFQSVQGTQRAENTSSSFIECTSPFEQPSVNLTSYDVKSGDSLWEIARKELRRNGVENPTAHETKLELLEIIDANKDNKAVADTKYGHILPGMHLVMPKELVVNTSSSAKADSGNADPKATTESSANSHVTVDASKHNHKTELETKAHHTHHHYLHDLESKIVSIGKMAIDGMHHWLDAVAGKAFLLAKHDAEANGVHIQISSAGRTFADQSRLYRQLHTHQSVALPGTSNHETGLAIDVTNWRQAKPYLIAHGFVHGDGHGALRNDPWHFKYVGQKADV